MRMYSSPPLVSPSASRRLFFGLWVSLLVLPLVGTLIAGLVSPPAHAEQAGSRAQRVAVASLDAGQAQECALSTTGAVRCWGYGGDGALGHNSTFSIGDGAPGDLSIQAAGDVPLGGKAAAISLGDFHSCALLTSGAVRCWGYGGDGQLGHGDTLNVGDGVAGDPSIQAAGDVPLGGRAVAITGGVRHTCALLTTGAVRCWGLGGDGELGHGDTLNVGDGVGGDPSIQAAGDVPIGGKATAIAAGESHTCALMATGSVRCWGRGNEGQLGHDSRANVGDGLAGDLSIQAADDVPIGGKAVAITAGGDHTCALLTTGAVRCWGYSGDGELGHDSIHNIGDGLLGHQSIEAAGDVPLGGTAVAITAGQSHTCAVLTTGAVRCWGRNTLGQLGYDSTLTIGDGVAGHLSIEAAGDVPLGGSAVAVTAGRDQTCAALTTGAVRCWGRGLDGQLGHDSTANIGDGVVGHSSIEAAGDVPIGEAVRVAAATRLDVQVAPRRDRRAPYVYAITGGIHGSFMADAPTCAGQVKITVRRHTHVLQTRTPRLDSRCGYHTRVRITGAELHVHRGTRLIAQIRFPGSTNLQPAQATRRLTAH